MKNGKFHRILVSVLVHNRLTAHSQSPQPLLSLLDYKRRGWGPISKRRHKRIETLTIFVFPLCSNIRQPHCEFELEFPFPPLQSLAISLERTQEENETWKQLVHCEEEPRTEFEEYFQSHIVSDFCEININNYFFHPAK
jgi:hypothetical protein